VRFELDDILIGEILFYMENQDGKFVLDTQEAQIVDISNSDYEDEPDFSDEERFISLPEWNSQDGYRLMEKFAAGLKNPVVRHELSAALNRNKGVFRSFKNVIEQYPETEKLWFRFKEQQMKNEVIGWYNSMREEWGLEPVGIEPEDDSSILFEDFIFRDGKEADIENAESLHKLCIEEKKDEDISALFEEKNPFDFSKELCSNKFCVVAESASGDFSGYICAVKDSPSHLRICRLEVKPEYRGIGLGKTLLTKLLEKTEKQTVTIDLPAGVDFFSRTLRFEEFKPCMQRFVRVKL
jgi:ribosomal protein S18 acetylase RimI-like enzyme